MSTFLPLLVLIAVTALPMQDVTPRAVLLAARDLLTMRTTGTIRRVCDRLSTDFSRSPRRLRIAHTRTTTFVGVRSALGVPATGQRFCSDDLRGPDLEHARRGLEARATDPEFHVVLANSRIAVARNTWPARNKI